MNNILIILSTSEVYGYVITTVVSTSVLRLNLNVETPFKKILMCTTFLAHIFAMKPTRSPSRIDKINVQSFCKILF